MHQPKTSGIVLEVFGLEGLFSRPEAPERAADQ